MALFLPKNQQSTYRALERLFGFSRVEAHSSIHSGYKAKNFKILADGELYFLKEYRQRMSEAVFQIKNAEQFFAQKGIPVLLPKKDVHGRSAFYLHGHWCSLFPFVESHALRVTDLSDEETRRLGTLLACVHIAGASVDVDQFQPFHLANKEQFFWEANELVQILREQAEPRPFDENIICTLEKKKRLIEQLHDSIFELDPGNQVLIHGDLTYQNVLVDEKGNMTHVIDFENTCVAPRSYEFARSMMINCFDDGWEDIHFHFARVFLKAYQSLIPLSFEEFYQGVLLYWANVMHTTWLEAKYVFSGAKEPENVYAYHMNRIDHLHEDPKRFCERIYYGY